MGVLRTLTIAVFFTCNLIGCNRSDPALKPAPTDSAQTILKVSVSSDGKITADGKTIALDELSQRMKSLKASSGIVWYHREAAKSEPHPNAMKVMELVVENKLPISLSTKPDFSDVVGPDGVPRPR